MHQFTVEVLQVSPQFLLTSLADAHKSTVALEAHFLQTGAVATYTASRCLGDGVFHIRSPHAADEVRISMSLPAASSVVGTQRRHLLASSRQPVIIGGPMRGQGACWVSMHATTPHGAMIDSEAEVGKVQLLWSVEALDGGTCACTPQARGCVCDARNGLVATHCPHCPLHQLNTENKKDGAVSPVTTTPSRRSLVSQDVLIDATPHSVADQTAQQASSATAGGAEDADVCYGTTGTQTSAVFNYDGHSVNTCTDTTAAGDTAAHRAVPPFALTTTASGAAAAVTATVRTARWSETNVDPAGSQTAASHGEEEVLVNTGNEFDVNLSPSPTRADHWSTATAQPSTHSPLNTSPPPEPCTPEQQVYRVTDTILYLGRRAPEDWQDYMNAEAAHERPLSRRELHHFLLHSFPRAEVKMDVVNASAVEVITGSGGCSPECGTGPHIDLYATSTQVNIPVHLAAKNLYTRPSPLVHLAAEHADYAALRSVLQHTANDSLLCSPRDSLTARGGTRWLHQSALDAIRRDHAAATENGKLSSFSLDAVRDQLDLLTALSDAERSCAPLASTPEQEATLARLKEHARKALTRTTVQY